jgi:class 3 adenylate cyclase
MNFFRRSFLLSVSLTFLLGYAVLDMSQFVFSNLVFYEEYQRERMTGVINLASLGKVLLVHDETRYLEKILKESVSLHQIDYYFIRKDDQVISFDSARVELDKLLANIASQAPLEHRFDGDLPHVAYRYGPYQLAIGLAPRKTDYIMQIAHKNRFSLIFDIALVVFMASAIAFFYFNDIRELINALKTPGKVKLKNLKPALAEASLMLQGIKTYETRVSELKQKQGMLSRNIASALRSELDSGRTPPYQFRCTMVRTDINQYSTIYSEQPVEDFMAVINEFFTRASKVIARYNGYVTDFVGDEIIYYFKDDDHENSAAVAAAAIRDINEIASSIHIRTKEQYGYPFTVKSAVASGSLRFGPHVNGYSLSGGAFVETVRILSQVEEKLENSVYLPARLHPRINVICDTEARKAVTLKGIPGLTELHKITRFHSIDEVIDKELHGTQSNQIAYYRSAKDVIKILDASSKALENKDQKAAMNLLKSIRLISHPFSDPELAQRYVSLLKMQLSMVDESSPLLSFCVSLARHLVATCFYPAEVKSILEQCLWLPDRRTVANAVEALMHFEPDHINGSLLSLLKHPDNRVVANTLIKLGMLDMGREVISGLNAMLDSEIPRFQASGAYAVGILTEYHKGANPVILEAHDGFAMLLRKITSLTSHSDPNVRRQALISQGKFASTTKAA